MPRVVYGDTEIIYKIKRRSGRTTAELALDPGKGVVVTCPPELSEERVQRLVIRKAPWILRKLKRAKQVVREPPSREYVSGETFFYLGKGYRLKVIEDESVYPFDIRLTGGRFMVRIPPVSDVHPREIMVSSALRSWFTRGSEKRLNERVSAYTSKVGVEPKAVVVKNQMKRWGSCTSEGILYLNWRIIMAPMSVVDYVIVHELTHMRTPDHSSAFWKDVGKVLSDYERRKEWLRVNGPTLQI